MTTTSHVRTDWRPLRRILTFHIVVHWAKAANTLINAAQVPEVSIFSALLRERWIHLVRLTASRVELGNKEIHKANVVSDSYALKLTK